MKTINGFRRHCCVQTCIRICTLFMPTDGVICCRYSHKYKALSPNVQLFLCWAKKLSQNKFQSTWVRRSLWPGILQVENVRSAENAANNAWFAIWGNHCGRRMRPIVHLGNLWWSEEPDTAADQIDDLKDFDFCHHLVRIWPGTYCEAWDIVV